MRAPAVVSRAGSSGQVVRQKRGGLVLVADRAQEAPDRFRIFRLYGWGTEPRAFLITPPLESSLILNPTAYRASFG